MIFTVHEEQGLANVQELHAILLRVQPEVIFLEVPAAAFDDFYVSRTRRNLESTAVHQFAESFPQTKLVPIDLPTPAREFFEDHEHLCMRVREASPRYRQLVSLDRDRLRAYGYTYLNSEHCSQHWSDVNAELVEAIEKIGEPRLHEIRETWDKANERRELEMIESIRKYCSRNMFEKGVFLVGAAHRRSLIEHAKQHSEIGWALLGDSGDA